ncbi:tetratricopeptide repeat protein [Vibrio parahaemolyticus]|uniref:tetratricopeptide repeat protein n=1 Tax=Vibrio TaxID=662 RepID=UPI001B81B4A0|nr:MULTISPECIES: tetratricopeptide repeat protein [Vibrio]MCA2422235.1 sel1 repeat family protein [Vibrio alginolyticus]MCA2446874.1 sel1 repeat family protein [Vibrio alginolyticus]MCR9821623.1 sel1 repeat family protein [Vibrio parahaemolyticus]MDF5109040.1 tetratricopeptide repeat protein [Vibrio parahaemolyticus]MDF5143945.1 tetratricopeptide repeat protein [Vibrio parahaemolyticus]
MKRPFKYSLLALSLGVAIAGYKGVLPLPSSEAPTNDKLAVEVQDQISASDYLTADEISANQLTLAQQPDALKLIEDGDQALSSNDYFAAYKFYSAAAQTKNTSAIIKLAELLEMGAIGGEPKIERALKLYQTASDLGSIDATLLLASFYELGINVPEDINKASELYLTAANNESPKALRWLVERARFEPGFAKKAQVMQWNLSLVKTGDMKAMLDAGNAYYSGTGVKQDKEMALKLFEDAAEQGNDSAHTMLAEILLYDHDVDRNPAQAVEWLKESATNGNPRAQAMLGIAISSLNDLAPEGITVDDKDAFHWIEKSLEQDYPLSHSYAGQFYLSSTGTKQDIPRAVEHFIRGTELGNADAMVNLGWQLIHGQGIEKDEKRAFELISAAADMNYPNAIYNLGWMYENGIGTKQDYEMAIKLYQKSADLDDPSGTYNLAEMYEKGRGINANTEAALRLYKEAHRIGDTRAKEKLDVYAKQGDFQVENNSNV